MDTTSRLMMFLDVVELGNFAKVAEIRNIDRSVISKQINKLEEELGVRLLNRSTRTFSLTAAGAEMVKKATELRFLLSETLQVAENYHTEPKGLLRITSSSIIARRYLQPVINDFQQRFPQVEVELRAEDRMVDVVGEGFDLAFRVGEPKVSNLISRPIARNRLVILASPTFINTYGEPANIEELAKLPAASYSSNSLRVNEISYISKQGNEISVPMNSTYRANDGDLLLLKILTGNAYFVAPSFLIGNEVKQGLLVPILTHIKLPEFRHLYAIYPHRDLPVRTRLFFDAVREHIGKDKPIWEENIHGFDNMYQ
ncbi:LysR family transcriptional regulator [Paraglaciecola aquimarina]|uniref:LysR family transcriptional regulator n=1 Tax=Paraglaciecola aquimarina TaxID=1235557 RepID=A0ABU3T024_9ALTE|nr:LysR family transcriptional regulator [Paraglaciecola aquimarina]MDU0355562.1 LysR family transcriptional regulator [Paraglaciecola aquimarina]